MKRIRTALICALVFCMVMTATALSFGAAEPTVSTWDGTTVSTSLESEGDTYYIKSAADLAYFAQSVNGGTTYEGKTVELKTGIVWNTGDASTWTADTTGLKAWTAIGGWGKPFKGTFDGKGYTISGLWANFSTDNVGFFGCTLNATIKNLIIANSAFFNNRNLGGLVGTVFDNGSLTVSNVIVEAKISAPNHEYVGGFIGAIRTVTNVSLTDCGFIGSVNGKKNVSGLIGTAYWGTTATNTISIDGCYVNGPVTATEGHIGGFISTLETGKKTVTIKDSVHNGTVTTGSGYAGGLIGQILWGDNTGHEVTITNCINIGTVNGSSDKGCITANKAGTTTYTNCVWETYEGAKGCANEITGHTGLPTAEIKALVDNTTWAADENGYPMPKDVYDLLNAPAPAPDTGNPDDSDDSDDSDLNINAPVFDLEDASKYTGTASTSLRTEGNVVYIDSAADLAYFAQQVTNGNNYANKEVKLTTDIIWNEGDASEWETTAPANAWQCGGWMKGLGGTFDGQGHTISGLYIKSSGDNIGFFACSVDKAVIKNLSLVNSTFICTRSGSAQANLGGLVGVQVGDLTVDNVFLNVNLITSGARNAGGVVGRVHDGVRIVNISNVVFAGTIDSGEGTGGIIGSAYINHTIIKNSATLNITNCANYGMIKGTTNVGGLVGYNENGETKFTGCVALAPVVGTNAATTGALFGGGTKDATMTNCYYDEQYNSKATGAGNTTGVVSADTEKLLGEEIGVSGWSVVENFLPLPTSVYEMLYTVEDTEGGNTEGGNTEGGNTEGGNTEGGNTDSENTNPGTSDNLPVVAAALGMMSLVGIAAVCVLRRRSLR